MWIRRKDYDAMLGRALEAQGAMHALTQQVATQKNLLEWFVLRLTQSEHERASLLHRYTGVEITVPTVSLDEVPTPAAAPSQIGIDLPSFNDVGDEEAKKLGLDWDETGRVTQHGKAIT